MRVEYVKTRLEKVFLGLICFALAACSTLEGRFVDGKDETTATVYRDDYGVPHIYADTEKMGFYGLGYAQAEDKLEGLLGAIYWASGRQAELMGPGALASDIGQRRWRHPGEGRKGFERLSPALQENYRYFVEGVKRFMADHPGKVPAWAPDPQPEDFVMISRALFWVGYAAVEGPRECQKRGAILHASLLQTMEEAPQGASNGWALAPSRTADRATILLADPHVGLQSPAYYEFRMDAGNLKSSGFALGPLLWQIHNRHVAWAMTTGNPDMWDCFSVEVDPDNPRRYLFDGEWQEMIVHPENFAINGAETEIRELEFTNHNGVLSPVVARDGNTAYVVSTSQMHDAGLLDDEIYRMNHARSVSDLRKALQTLGMFPQNLVMADASGSLYYVRAGKTPIRPEGHDWTAAVPGNSSETAWQGYHGIEEHPQVLDPKQGYLQNNNVAPDAMFSKDNQSASTWPGYLFNDTPGRITTRGVRSIEVLAEAQDFGFEDAFDHAFDEKSVTAVAWQEALAFALKMYPRILDGKSKATRDFIDGLLAFDGFVSAESVKALQFYYWRSGMSAALPEERFSRQRHFPWTEELYTEDFGRAMVNRAEVAAREMQTELGSVEVALGDVFRIGRGEKSWPLGGESIVSVDEAPRCLGEVSPLCERTMRAYASKARDANGQRRAMRGTNAMRLVQFTNPIRSWSVHIHGQSDDPASPHFDDQSILASEKRFKPTWFNRDELEGHVKSTLVLTRQKSVE